MSTRRVSWIIQANVDRWSKNLKSAQRDMDRFGRNMQRLGRTMSTYITAPVVAAGGASMKMAADFESSMSKIEGLVGLARSEVDGMKDSVLGLAGQTARPPQELADALFFVTSAGLRGKDAMDVLEQSARAAAAGLGETKDVADLVTSAMNAYGKENLDASKATDILTAAVREGKAEATELASSMGQVLPLASELGVTFDQVGAATAAMTRTGTDAATAATQLRQILASLLKPSSQAETAMKEMGTSSAELRKTLREDGLVEVLGFMREQMEDNEQAMAQVFPNIRALSGVLDIMGSNAEENVGIFDRMTDSTGALDNAFEAAADTSAFKFKQAISELRAEAVRFGNVMLPVANKVLEAVTNMIRSFSEMEEQSRVKIVGMAAALAAGGPFLIALGTAARVMAGFAGLVVSKFTLIAGAFAVGVGAGQWLVDNWQAFGEIIRREIDSWVNAFESGFQKLTTKAVSFMARMSSHLIGPIGAAVSVQAQFNEEIEHGETKITSFADSFKKGIGEIGSAMAGLVGADDALNRFFRLFEPGGATEQAGESAERFGNTIERVSIESGKSMTDMASAMVRSVDTVERPLVRMTEKAIEMGQALQATVTSAITDFAETLGDAFTGDAGASGFFQNILMIVTDFGKQLGRMLVAAGIAAQAFQMLLTNPVGAIIAGGALIAAATAARNLLATGPTTSVNDALVRSDGSIVEFHPDDNILAMKDFSNLNTGGGMNRLHITGTLVGDGNELKAVIDESTFINNG